MSVEVTKETVYVVLEPSMSVTKLATYVVLQPVESTAGQTRQIIIIG